MALFRFLPSPIVWTVWTATTKSNEMKLAECIHSHSARNGPFSNMCSASVGATSALSSAFSLQKEENRHTHTKESLKKCKRHHIHTWRCRIQTTELSNGCKLPFYFWPNGWKITENCDSKHHRIQFYLGPFEGANVCLCVCALSCINYATIGETIKSPSIGTLNI